ncbi:MAG: hypothetical protein [Bacteriophage sp.]|nr:MAG: hypothetical protein [Bacteriophage sp.]
MRLGYSEYQTRLQSIREHRPERYAAIMEGQKTFTDLSRRCPRCESQERYTRNMACAGCARARIHEVFTVTTINGDESISVYTPEDEAQSNLYQERVQRSQYRKFYLRKLAELGEVRCGGWSLIRGVLLNSITGHRISLLNPTPEQSAEISRDECARLIHEHVLHIIGELPD